MGTSSKSIFVYCCLHLIKVKYIWLCLHYWKLIPVTMFPELCSSTVLLLYDSVASLRCQMPCRQASIASHWWWVGRTQYYSSDDTLDIHTPFFSAKRQNSPSDLFRIDWYLRPGFWFLVGSMVRSYTMNVPTYKIFFYSGREPRPRLYLLPKNC